MKQYLWLSNLLNLKSDITNFKTTLNFKYSSDENTTLDLITSVITAYIDDPKIMIILSVLKRCCLT